MFTWSRLEIWMAVALAALIVIGGTGHLLLAATQGQRTIVVEAKGAAQATSSDDGDVSQTAPTPPVASENDVARESPSDCITEAGVEPDTRVPEATGLDAAGSLISNPETPDSPGVADTEQDTLFVVDDRININTAQPSELQRLPGIGPALAARIVAYREAWGPFGAIEDIVEVSGIGSVTFEKMKHMLKVD